MRAVLHAAALAAGIATGHAATAQQADPALVEEGRYLATAGDCAGCHGFDLAGGDPVPSPIGAIYASNITPDRTGLDGWTLAQFEGVMRRGEGPEGHIYPAMPYTSYTGLSDRQVAAIYSYLMLGVEPVANKPPETDLGFPFYRPMMAGWNLLFLDEGQAAGAQTVAGTSEERGRVLVETLGHCTACHSPRGQLMQQLPGRHLAGGMIDGWSAPNITPDPSGIGNWPDAEVARFLATGHAADGVAGGEMGKVVSRSLSLLPPEDIVAIVAYLRAIPPVVSDLPERLPGTRSVDVASIDPAGVDQDWRGMLSHDTLDGATLYQSACAACHGLDGDGSAGLEHPSLRRVTARDANAANLVQVVAHGIDRTVGDTHVLMPGFRDAMSDDQVAAVASYVRTEFGGVAADLDAPRISAILSGDVGTPWLIANARWLAALGLATAGLVVLALLAWLVLHGRRRRTA